MTALHLDYETRSTVDLKKAGAYAYAEHPSTGVWCFSWKFDGEETRLWLEGDPLPQRVIDHVAAGGKVVAQNAAFERIVTNTVMRRLHPGFPAIAVEQQDCTMARGLALGLPAGLEMLAAALNTPVQKDKEGAALMMRMCRPRKMEPGWTGRKCEECAGTGELTYDRIKCGACSGTGDEYGEVPVWWDDPAKVERLGAYCVTDTDTEALVDQGLPKLTDSEQAVWRLDQKINDRGVAIDVALVERAIAVVTEAQRRADDEMWRLTDGEVRKCSEAGKLVEWLNARGVPCESVAKGEMEELVVKAAMIDADAEAAVRLRRASAKSSTAKFKAMLNSVCADGRCRGTLQYHAAGTGRWGGRLIQPQNLPRINDPKAVERTLELLGADIPVRGLVDALEMLTDNPLDALSQCLRAMLVAGPGKKFVGGDFSNIEGRLNAWIAGEQWKVEAFRQFDAGAGPDLYKLAYAKSFGIEVDAVTKVDRQVGKVMELACIAEGQLVLTDGGLVPIEQVTVAMRVWDGLDFVQHDGVVCRGTKEVLTHDGLTATADHVVWVEGSPRPVAFGDAAARGQRLVRSGAGRTPVRLGGDRLTRASVPERMAGRVRSDTLHRLRARKLDRLGQSDEGCEQRMLPLLAAAAGAGVATKARDGYAFALHQPEGRGLAAVRGPRHPLRVSVGDRGCDLGAGEPGSRPHPGVGPDRQQRTLRARQPALRHQDAADAQPAAVEDHRVGRRVVGDTEPARAARDAAVSGGRLSEGSDHRVGVQGRAGAPEELARDRAQVARARVYDIVNAGPRHRFTVSGRLVHNCGYQGGVGAFQTMAAGYGLRVTDARADELKVAWREAHPAIVQSWWDLQDAAIEAVGCPGAKVSLLGGKVAYIAANGFLFCQLPSKRVIAYATPRLEWVETKAGRPKRQIVYMGVDSMTKRWCEQRLYGGLQCNNVVQGTARDVMVESMHRAEAEGFEVVLTVHDELLTEAPKGSLRHTADTLQDCMAVLPAWAHGLPLAAAAWEDTRYVK